MSKWPHSKVRDAVAEGALVRMPFVGGKNRHEPRLSSVLLRTCGWSSKVPPIPVALAIAVGFAASGAALGQAEVGGSSMEAGSGAGGAEGLGWLGLFMLVAAPVVLVILWLADVIRPGSPERHAARDVRPLAWYVWLVAAFSIYASTMLGRAMGAGLARAMALPLSTFENPATTHGDVIVQSCAMLMAIGVGCWLLASLGRSLPRAGLGTGVGGSGGVAGSAWRRGGDWLTASVALALALPVVMASSVLATVVYEWSGGEVSRVGHATLVELIEGGRDPWAIPVILIAIVGAPLVEEMVFRAGVQSAILSAINNRWAAIVLTSLVFASIHLSAVPVYGLMPLFVLSVAMGLAYERTGRLGVPILMHAIFNAINVAMAFWVG